MFKLKLNHVLVLGPDDVGKLTLNDNFLKLKLNHASILGPDDVGKLTLNGNFLSV